MSKTRDILILRGGGLGDTLLALPAVRALARTLSPCRIEWAGNPAVLPVLPMGLPEGSVNRLRSADGPELAALRRADVPREEILRAFSRKTPYDLLIAWTPGDESFEENLRALAKRALRADPHPPRTTPSPHASDYLLQSLNPLGIDPAPETGAPEVRPGAEEVGEAASLLSRLGVAADGPRFLLHPGSGGRWKCWSLSRFVRLAEALSSAGDVLWVTGPAEEGVLEEVRRLSRERGLKAVASPSLPCLAGLLRGARGYVGSDSGVTHLAAACGAPTVALFGPTDPAVWGPRGQRVVILRRSAGCASCETGRRAGHTCLAAIDVEEVLEAVLGFG